MVVHPIPAFKDLRSLFAKTFAVAGVLRSVLAPLDGIEMASVYGSVASGEERASSDIDLFVVGDVNRRQFAVALSDAEAVLGRDVNATVYDRARLAKAILERNRFVLEVLSKPTVHVIGESVAVGRLPE